jgi:hypothetical protein
LQSQLNADLAPLVSPMSFWRHGLHFIPGSEQTVIEPSPVLVTRTVRQPDDAGR